jgi:hypothetical protein
VPLSDSLNDSDCHASEHFAILSGSNGILQCSQQNRDFNAGDGSIYSAVQLRQRFGLWLPPSGLKARYDVFVSYRWTGKIDDDLALGLFNNLDSHLLACGRKIDVFLDKRRLQDGRNFQDDFANALLNSQLPVVVMSTEALKRMATLEAGSGIDNLFLEWTLITELLELRKINECLPILIGTFNESASTCADSISNFFSKTRMVTKFGFLGFKGFSCEVSQQTVEEMPDIVVSSVVAKTRSILGQHGLSESPELSRRTVRDVLRKLSLHQAVKTWDLVKSPKLSACAACSVKNEVMGALIEHCASRIRSMLDGIDPREKQQIYTNIQRDGMAAGVDGMATGGGSNAGGTGGTSS